LTDPAPTRLGMEPQRSRRVRWSHWVRRHSVGLVRIFLDAIEAFIQPRSGIIDDRDRFPRGANIGQRHPVRRRQPVSHLDCITDGWLREKPKTHGAWGVLNAKDQRLVKPGPRHDRKALN